MGEGERAGSKRFFGDPRRAVWRLGFAHRVRRGVDILRAPDVVTMYDDAAHAMAS